MCERKKFTILVLELVTRTKALQNLKKSIYEIASIDDYNTYDMDCEGINILDFSEESIDILKELEDDDLTFYNILYKHSFNSNDNGYCDRGGHVDADIEFIKGLKKNKKIKVMIYENMEEEV